MFTQLSENELYDVDGGLALVAKIVIGVIVTVFAAGTVKGCTDEAAKGNN